jgi:hypothetical protein
LICALQESDLVLVVVSKRHNVVDPLLLAQNGVVVSVLLSHFQGFEAGLETGFLLGVESGAIRVGLVVHETSCCLNSEVQIL